MILERRTDYVGASKRDGKSEGVQVFDVRASSTMLRLTLIEARQLIQELQEAVAWLEEG